MMVLALARVDEGGRVIGSSEHDSAELLIDCEEDQVVRVVLVGMLREIDRPHWAH